jgi:hypothetical protein
MPYIDVFQPNYCDNQSILILVVLMASRGVASKHIRTADFNPVLKNFGRAHGTGKWVVPTAFRGVASTHIRVADFNAQF